MILAYGFVAAYATTSDPQQFFFFFALVSMLIIMAWVYRHEPAVHTVSSKPTPRIKASEPMTELKDAPAGASTTPPPVAGPEEIVQARIVTVPEAGPDPELLEELEIVSKLERKGDRRQAAMERILARRGRTMDDLERLEEPDSVPLAPSPQLNRPTSAKMDSSLKSRNLVQFPTTVGIGYFGNVPVKIDDEKVLVVKALLSTVCPICELRDKCWGDFGDSVKREDFLANTECIPGLKQLAARKVAV